MCIAHCTEMFSDSVRCPIAPISSQEEACWDSVFPEDFYKESTNKICQ